MSNYIHISQPAPKTYNQSVFFKDFVNSAIDDLNGDSGSYNNFGQFEIIETTGFLISTSVTFNHSNTARHIVSAKFQWSLDGILWNDYVVENGKTTSNYLQSTTTGCSEINIQSSSTLLVQQFLNAPELNYNKEIRLRIVLNDFFGVVYTKDLLIYTIKYSDRAWFHTDIVTDTVEDETDTQEIPLLSIPAEKAYVDFNVTYFNSFPNTYVLTVGTATNKDIILLNETESDGQLYNVEAAVRFVSLIDQSSLVYFDIQRNGTIVRFIRKTVGLNPITLVEKSVTFGGNITCITVSPLYDGKNEIVFQELNADSNTTKIYFNNKRFLYFKTEISQDLEMQYSNNGTNWSTIPFQELNNSVLKIESVSYGESMFIRFKSNLLNRISNIVEVFIGDVNFAFFESLVDLFNSKIDNELIYTDFNTLIDNFERQITNA